MANLPTPTTPHVSDNFAPYLVNAQVDAQVDAAPRHARLFRNGANQAVRIPKEFEFPPGEVTVKKVGNSLVLEAVAVKPTKGTLAGLVAALESMKDWPVVVEPFPDVDEGLLPLDAIDL